MDRIDRQILHAIQIDGRAPFSRVAAVLGTSEQTIARRYRRMHVDGVVRVLGQIDLAAQGQTRWFVRAQCRPDAAGRLAETLAHRSDVSWVGLTAGGSEVTCVTSARHIEQQEELLRRLPRTSQILSFEAHWVLHRFVGGGPDWDGLPDPLTGPQITQLCTAAPPTKTATALRAEDDPLLDVLARDGRASFRTLAAATGWPEARVTRRVEQLRAAGILYIDVEIATSLFGFTTSAYLWLTVAPGALPTVGGTVTAHRQVTFAAAVTGSANLLLSVLCHDAEELYGYVTKQVGRLDGVQRVEISPVLRRIKQAGTLLSGARLGETVVAPRRG